MIYPPHESQDLSSLLLRSGLAQVVEEKTHPHLSELRSIERVARASLRGVWGLCQSEANQDPSAGKPRPSSGRKPLWGGGFSAPAPLTISVPSEGGHGRRPCCRVCGEGKPCGDSCIARWKTCHKGEGCAC
jgi:hypothetical protein